MSPQTSKPESATPTARSDPAPSPRIGMATKVIAFLLCGIAFAISLVVFSEEIAEYRRGDPTLDEEKLKRMVVEWHHHPESEYPAILRRVQAAVAETEPPGLLRVPLDETFSVELGYHEIPHMWIPINVLRMVRPERSAYAKHADFIQAMCEYHAAQWILENTILYGARAFTEVGCPVRRKDGTWHVDAGPARVAGAGLSIITNDDGELIQIDTISSPD